MSQNNIRQRQTQEMTNPLQRSGSFVKNPHPENLTDKQKKAILLSLPAGESMYFYADTLSTGWNQEQATAYLQENLKVKNSELARASIDFSFQEGERTIYNILLPHLLVNKELPDLLDCLKKRYLSVALLQVYAENLHKGLHLLHSHSTFQLNRSDLVEGIFAWDIIRIILLTRLSWDAGFFTQEEALNHAEKAVDCCKSRFKSWESIVKSFLIGEAMRNGANSHFATTLEITTKVLTEKESPWKETTW